MGEVYSAEDLKLGGTVALKLLPDTSNKRKLAMFLEEARIARKLSHPNVCRVYDIGVHKVSEVVELHFISMEFIDGEDLACLLRRIGRLPKPKALEVSLDLCEGLAAIHEAGFLHRDIKPSNVMVDSEGRARLTDFGLAMVRRDRAVQAGTPAYMAPEQHMGLKATTRSDIYSLGLVIHEIFSGERVFQASSQREYARLHLETTPILTCSWDWEHTPEVGRILSNCLEKSPERRPTSVRAISKALTRGIPDSRSNPPDSTPCAAHVPSTTLLGVPHRNPHFTGREALITALHSHLQQNGSAALAQAAVFGLGGIGKTQTAIEYVHRFSGKYRFVFWVAAETEAGIGGSYQAIFRELNLGKPQADLDAVIRAVKGWLSRQKDWLLVLDNADEPAMVRDFLPSKRDGGKVLLTSRASDFDAVAINKPFRVEVMMPEEAVELLVERSGSELTEGAAELAEELGYLPLALEQAAAYMKRHRTSFTAYLSSFRNRGLKLMDKFAPAGYEKTVATTWSVSIEAIEKDSMVSAKLLNAAAFLVPDSIPIEVFTLGAEQFGGLLGDALEAAKEDPLVFWEVLEPLERYSLVERLPGDTFKLHRLTQKVVRRALGDQQEFWAEGVVKALNSAFPLVKFETWAQCERLQANVLKTSKLIGLLEIQIGEAAFLLGRAGHFSWERGEPKVAIRLMRVAYEICKRVLGDEHPSTLTSMINLAENLRVLGDLPGAKRLQEKALEISECVLGDEHPQTLTSRNNLAGTLGALRDFTGAKRLQEKTLQTRKRILGCKHPQTLTSMNNLAESLRCLGDFVGARRLHEKVLKIRERALGPEHPSTLMSANNLALTFHAFGNLAGARRLQEKTLEICERVVGSEHPGICHAINNLAATLYRSGEAAEARVLFKRLFDLTVSIVGARHPSSTAAALWLLYISQEENEPTASSYWLEKLRWLADRSEDEISSPSQRRARAYVLKVLANRDSSTLNGNTETRPL